MASHKASLVTGLKIPPWSMCGRKPRLWLGWEMGDRWAGPARMTEAGSLYGLAPLLFLWNQKCLFVFFFFLFCFFTKSSPCLQSLCTTMALRQSRQKWWNPLLRLRRRAERKPTPVPATRPRPEQCTPATTARWVCMASLSSSSSEQSFFYKPPCGGAVSSAESSQVLPSIQNSG